MHRSFLTNSINILAGILIIGLFLGPGLIHNAGAAEYHNPAVDGEESSDYWNDRGGLLATYGNYLAAIKAYKKALTLDPNLSAVYFNLALAYCEIGEFELALSAINTAVDMEPDNPHYYYGRGWTLLLYHGADEAQDDFQKAAELGDQDAVEYLEGKGTKPSPLH